MTIRSDILVAGAGAAGLTTAIALAGAGFTVVVAGGLDVRRNGRTVALFEASLRLYRALGLWGRLEPLSMPLRRIRLVDDTGSLFRAPPVTFKASELKLDAFGYNVELPDLVASLSTIASGHALITRFDTHVSELSSAGDGSLAAVLASGQTLHAPIILGADGRKSAVRAFAGIEVKEWSYPQTALTAVFKHQRDHHDISTEFHTRQGPFTLVPLPGRRSSLVWMMDPQKAERLANVSDKTLTQEVEKQAQFILGTMNIDGDRGLVPMAGLTVNRYASENIALLGEAAHVFPPIGAQGLNLGFRDVSALLEAFSSKCGPEALAKYNAARQADVKLRTAAVDVMNKSLLADYLPIDLARSIGLLTIASIPPLRRFMMQRGAGY